MTQARISFIALLVGSLTWGCSDGKKKSAGPSLDALYRKAMAEPDLAARAVQLLSVADKQTQAGDVLGRDQSLAAAADAAKNVDNAQERALVLNRVAECCGRAGQTTEARGLLREVSQTADQIDDLEIRVTALARMACTYGKYLNSQEIAAGYLKNNAELASGITDPAGRINAWLEIAVAWHGFDQPAQARAQFEQAVEAARAIEDPRARADAVASTAMTANKLGDRDQAAAIFDEAEKRAGEIPDPLSRAYALLELSAKLKASGRTAQSQRAIKLAEAAADKVSDSSLRQPLLETIDRARR